MSYGAHLPSIFPCLPLHGLIEHKLHCRIEDQQQGRERAIPQCPNPLISYDLGESVLQRKKKLFNMHQNIYTTLLPVAKNTKL